MPRDARVVGAGRGPEWIDDRAFHRPIEPAQIGGADRSRAGGGAARFRLAARALQRFDAVIERLFVALQAGEPLLGLARAAPCRAQAAFARALERQVAVQLGGAL